jgi:nucleotide-binding universal stress UspA family protein
VSPPASTFAIRRILVALDASPHSLAALDMAVDLAARVEAELAGLFVEDVELLRMAELPSAREIADTTAHAIPLDRSIMERKLRAQSEQIRNAVAAAAQRAQVRWSFQTVRGQVTSALRAAVTEDDIVAIGRLGWSFWATVTNRFHGARTGHKRCSPAVDLATCGPWQPAAAGLLRWLSGF